jgi:hypothetical protein
MKRIMFTLAMFLTGFTFAFGSGRVWLAAGNGGIFYEDAKTTLFINFEKGTWEDDESLVSHFGRELDSIADIAHMRFAAHINEASKGLEVVDNERFAEYDMILTVNKLVCKANIVGRKKMKIWGKLDVYDKRTDRKVCTVSISDYAGKGIDYEESEALCLTLHSLAYELFKVRVRP